MSKKILLVEDEAIIAMTTTGMLKKHGYEVIAAHKGEKAVEIVDNDPEISLILMDIDLGKGMDGTEAAEKILFRHELPIVFLTSHSEKEYVDRVKKITNYGYVLKNSGEFVLIESINMAYELFKAHREVQEREERYRSIFYNSHSPMMLIEPATGNIIDVNPAASEFYDWPAEIFYTMKIQDINQLSHEEVLQEMERARIEERNVFYFKHTLSDGTIRDVEVRSSPISIKGKQLLYSIIHDITERKKAEDALRESEQFIKTVMDHLPLGIAVNSVDPAVEFSYMNDNFPKIYRTSREALANSDVFWDVVYEDPEFRQKIKKRVEDDCASGNPEQMQWQDIPFTRNGEGPFYICARNIPLHGTKMMISTVWDVTERKRAEERLKTGEQSLRMTLNSIGDAVISTDIEGNIARMNPVAENLCGWSISEAKGKALEEVFYIVHADTGEKVENPVAKVLEKGNIIGLANHTVLISKDGHEYQIADSASPIRGDDGNINGVVLVFRDVTDEYEKEERLKKQAYRLQRTQEIAHIGNWELDLVTQELYWSDEIYRIFGLTPQEFGATYEAFLNRVHPEDRDSVDAAYFGSIRAGSDTYEIEHRIIRSDNSEVRYVYEKCEHIRNESGEIIRSIGMVQDITEQKKNEVELNKSKDRYKRLVNNSPNLIMETDVDTQEIISCNPAMAKNLGTTIPEVVGKKIDDFIPPDILKKRIEVSHRAIETGEPQTLEDERNGKHFHTTHIPIISNERRSIQTITIDITEQKKSENMIKEYANRLELTMVAANMAWWEMDINSGNVRFNKKKAEMLGYPVDQFHNYEDFTKLVYTDDYEPMMTSMRALLHGTEDRYDIEYRIKAHSGNYRWFHDIGTITERSEEGSPVKVAGIVIDITDNKNRYEELQETRKRFDLAMEGTGAGLWDWDMKSDSVVYSERWKSMLGYEDHEIENSFYGWKKLWHPDDAPRIEKAMTDYIEGKTDNYEIIHRLRYKDGSWRWILTRGVILKDSEGNPCRWVGTNLDITNSKQNEEELKKTLEEKDFLMKELNHRVKNNLNMVSSLISIKDAETETDLSDIMHQIEAIGLIHEKLHQTENVTEINCREYLDDLLNSIFTSFTTRSVRIEKHIEDICVSTKMAVPLGLIINEIATNAIKYGFNNREEPVFSIGMKKENNQYELTLSNTGNPFPEDIDLQSTETIGLRVINTLVAQINGTIELQKTPNPVFTIRFPVENG